MMYKNQMAACLKQNGRVLREVKDPNGTMTVFIPFGSEYSISTINQSQKRAIVHIYIDGNKVSGSGLVSYPNKALNLERAISAFETDNSIGNKFKFIERTAKIEAKKGIGALDGLIKIEWSFEKEIEITADLVKCLREVSGCGIMDCKRALVVSKGNFDAAIQYLRKQTYASSIRSMDTFSDRDVVTKSLSASFSAEPTRGISKGFDSFAPMGSSMPENDVGITVAGSRSDQTFTKVEGFETESVTHTMILQIKGETADNTPVEEPITVYAKLPKCDICDHPNPFSAKFCAECGTSLVKYR